MEMKRMIVGLVLIATFALPALNATLEKDFITREAINMVLKKVSPISNSMLDEQAISALSGKILVSNPIIEEALLKHSNLNIALGGGSVSCGETCVYIPCVTSMIGCSCRHDVCYYNSLAAN